MKTNKTHIFSTLLPILGWLFQLCTSFILSSYACELGNEIHFHLITLIALIFALSGLWMAKKGYQHSTDKTWPLINLFLGSILVVIILIGDIGNFLLEICL